MNVNYFKAFEKIKPPEYFAPTAFQQRCFHISVGAVVGLGIWYFMWRWSFSLNPDALFFSVLVAGAETGMFIGGLLFFYDIWSLGDTPRHHANIIVKKDKICWVDIFITTFSEAPELLEATIKDAQNVRCPKDVCFKIHLLDDGQRDNVRALAQKYSIAYVRRPDNSGFKAGNLKNGLFKTSGDFIVICDADTRLFPSFLENTLGYFNDPEIAWVQTPHWFYDIPQGYSILELCPPLVLRLLPKKIREFFAKCYLGADPYCADGGLFFDVIQRRRNRNGASFCCGAASIHRREHLMRGALSDWVRRSKQKIKPKKFNAELMPFYYHISEDILTSIKLHSLAGKKLRSVYHPKVEAKMLSPWSYNAWAGQRLRYATGTIDIFFRHNPLFTKSLGWRTKLHYLATFAGYFSVFWCFILIVAPIFTLISNVAPVASYSSDFFLHLLPLLIANQIALTLGCVGHNAMRGSFQTAHCFGITLYAFWLIISNKSVAFRTTPKMGADKTNNCMRFLWINLILIIASIGAFCFAISLQWIGYRALDWPLLIVNGFWIFYNVTALGGAFGAVIFPQRLPQQFSKYECNERNIADA